MIIKSTRKFLDIHDSISEGFQISIEKKTPNYFYIYLSLLRLNISISAIFTHGTVIFKDRTELSDMEEDMEDIQKNKILSLSV